MRVTSSCPHVDAVHVSNAVRARRAVPVNGVCLHAQRIRAFLWNETRGVAEPRRPVEWSRRGAALAFSAHGNRARVAADTWDRRRDTFLARDGAAAGQALHRSRSRPSRHGFTGSNGSAIPVACGNVQGACRFVKELRFAPTLLFGHLRWRSGIGAALFEWRDRAEAARSAQRRARAIRGLAGHLLPSMAKTAVF